MTRDEILNKLKSLKPTAFPTTATMDMGLEFDVLTAEGAYTYLGAIGDWPVWVFDRLESSKVMELKNKIDKNINLTAEDFKNTDLYKFAKKLENREDFEFHEKFQSIINFEKSDESKYVYAYCDLGEWVPDLDFYGTDEEISKVFFSSFPGSTLWDDLDDNWLSTYYEELEEHGEGLPFNSSENLYDEDES